jgi:hypothetical protein
MKNKVPSPQSAEQNYQKYFLKKVLSFSESDWIGGIKETVNKILLNIFF